MMPLIAAETGVRQVRAPLGAPWLSPAMRVVRALGEVCRDLRLAVNDERGLPDTDYGAVTDKLPHGAGRDPRTLKAFEEGTSNPTHLDDVIRGYAEASGIEVDEIWGRAIKQALAAADAPANVDKALDEIAQAANSTDAGRGRKPGAKRNRGATS